MPTYTASKTRDAGRDRYSVIFRHPARFDPSTGRPGRRVRRGLGTSDPAEADVLVGQLNELLAAPEFWSTMARATVEGRFDARVLAAFYDGMEPVPAAASATMRDRFIPLPGADAGYRRVLLLGTTGAGKTTVVRQLLGTDPESERFPSTSSAKTTIADTEIIFAEAPFRAVVTFFRRDEVVDHLLDNASRAALASLRGAGAAEVRRLLLDHEDQRFRFSYVLGRQEQAPGLRGRSAGAVFDDLDDGDDESSNDFEAEPEGISGIDLAVTKAVIDRAVSTLGELVKFHDAAARENLVRDGDDERVAQELVEEQLDKMLRGDERFNAVVDSLLDEIEKRFDVLSPGAVTRDQQTWPSTWSWESPDRVEFIRAVNRFSSNYAPRFGHLLSPLVDGIRVSGPFKPIWFGGSRPRLVLVDGEGLGHTARSAVSLPTVVAESIEKADAVLLVDNAAQPALAAAASAIRSILTSGNTEKLSFCFTHFDEVKGDNLRSANDRALHVLASVENLLSSIRDEFGMRSERAVRRRLVDARFFLAGVDKPVDTSTPSGRLTVGQLSEMLRSLQVFPDRRETGPARPVYDRANVGFAIAAAASSFHRRWRAVLGLTYEPDVDKEHWTRVKALNRRYAEGSADQYDTLRPASDLRELLKDAIYKTLEAPLSWRDGTPPSEEEMTAIIDGLSRAIANRLIELVRDRLSERPMRAWQDAYALSGPRSTFARARQISDDVFIQNVPVPGATPSPDQNDFLRAVIGAIEDAAGEVGAQLR